MDTRRRSLMQSVGALALLLGACRPQRSSAPPDDDPEALLRHRFRGIAGGELRIDAFEQVSRIALYLESGLLLAAGIFSRGAKISGYGGHAEGDRLVVPPIVRMVRYAPEARRQGGIREPVYDGKAILDVTVPVAERIPDAALDRIRQYRNASLSLKLRIHPRTLLVGWEVRLGRGYPFKRDKWGNAYTTDEDEWLGGDFAERRMRLRLVNERLEMVALPGWYIDPDTGERVESDF